jgi:hypothetical protein
MRLGILAAALAALALSPALGFAQPGDAGPDAGMNAQNRAAAATGAAHTEAAPAGDAHADADCDKPLADDKGPDARADPPTAPLRSRFGATVQIQGVQRRPRELRRRFAKHHRLR